MKSFHKTMGLLSGIFLLMIVGSVSVASSYMTNNDITIPLLFSDSTEITESASNKINIWDSGSNASSYDTITTNRSETFNVVEEIFISSSTEEVIFIEEDRNNILVEFEREQPDTDNYEVLYNTNSSNNKLTISATLKSKGISINKVYKGSIKIYVPEDYHFDKVTIDSGAAKITSDNIYTNTNNLTAIASFGDIDIDIDDPINEVLISCNFGSIKVGVNDEVNNLDITCDMGTIDLEINDGINELSVKENMGDVDIEGNSPIGSVTVENNMGAIKAEFSDFVEYVDIENNMGDINVTFLDNNNMTIYIDASLGSVHSDFVTTDSNKSNYKFKSNMGSIKVFND